MTQTTRAMMLACGLILAASQPALAQGELLGRWFLNVNGGFQAPGRDLPEVGAVPLYAQDLTFEGTREIGSSLIIDAAAGMHVSEAFAIGVAYSWMSDSSDVILDASVPHPLFTDRPRAAAAVLEGLGRTEHGIHLMALWRVPLLEGVDLKVGGGPSFFRVSEDGPSTATATEVGEPFDAVAVAFGTDTRSKNGVGFNITSDITYLINERLGAGILLRYTMASIEVPMPGGVTRDDNGVGGLQFGAGLRLRF
ncbi:MAG TPA: hypothetical protein VK911_08815 [Vicinamibacterales bacterium]|nr:hypothetical protein [Vicinamibacterales bacterium]